MGILGLVPGCGSRRCHRLVAVPLFHYILTGCDIVRLALTQHRTDRETYRVAAELQRRILLVKR